MSLRLPRIYLLPTNLGPDELQSLENRIPSLTRDVREAEVIVGRITRRERALFELRRLKLPLSLSPSDPAHPEQQQQDHQDHPTKRRRVSPTGGTTSDDAAPSVKVVKLQWLNDCLEQDTVLPMGNSLLFAGRKLETPEVQVLSATPSPRHSQVSSVTEPSVRSGSVIASAHRQEQTSCSPRARRPPALIRETTSEHGAPLPPVPDYLHTVYSCQRPTPVDTPNASFIEQMKKLRTLRRLEHDEVGVRAYSTSIATIAAYPYALGSPLEISRLPGCGPKIVELFKQWKNTGTLEEVEKGDADAMVSVLKLFYGIWGVGEATAREFYNKGKNRREKPMSF